MALNSWAVARIILSAIGILCSKLSLEAAIANGAYRSTTIPFCMAKTACSASFSQDLPKNYLENLIYHYGWDKKC